MSVTIQFSTFLNNNILDTGRYFFSIEYDKLNVYKDEFCIGELTSIWYKSNDQLVLKGMTNSCEPMELKLITTNKLSGKFTTIHLNATYTIDGELADQYYAMIDGRYTSKRRCILF